MKPRILALILAYWPVIQSQSVWAEPLGTSFSYQGRLHDQGAPANGLYDLRFILYNAEFGGSQVGNVLTNAGLSVGNGLFTATLDFGLGPFEGPAYWLEVAVRTNNSVMSFIPLHPRQRLMPTPYALHALNAGFAAKAASVPWSGITGVPAGFSNTIYTAGVGLSLSPGNEFSVIFDGSGMNNAAARSDHTHSAADLVSGVLADERLSSNVALLSAHQLFAGTNLFAGVTILTNEANLFIGSFQGNGEGLTNLMAMHLVGTLLDSQLSTNVPRLDANQTFVGSVGFAPTSGPPFTVGSSGTVSNLSADLLDGLDSAGFWKTGGNAGTVAGTNFLGTTDTNALEFRANSMRVLRLEPGSHGSPNTVGGSPWNVVDPGVSGAVIGGGGATNYSGRSFTNRISSDHSTIAGGLGNTIEARAFSSTIGGGVRNTIEVGGEFYNSESTISGGVQNVIHSNAANSTIAGGGFNGIQPGAGESTISGGNYHTIQANARWSVISGGHIHTIGAGAKYSTIGGGHINHIQTNAQYATIGGGSSNVIGGSFGTVAGGDCNTASGLDSSVGGGCRNTANSPSSTVAGGCDNTANGNGSSVGGGASNSASADYATVAGGGGNTAVGLAAIVGGGRFNEAAGRWSNVSGGEGNTSAADYATVGGGAVNTASGAFSAIGGGYRNTSTGFRSSVGGGDSNSAVGQNGTVGGGRMNIAAGNHSIVGGGVFNSASNTAATVAGGQFNTAAGNSSTIGGGWLNSSGGEFAAIGGGALNITTSHAAYIGGGHQNGCSGDSAFVGGGNANNSIAMWATIGGGGVNVSSGFASTVAGGERNTSQGDYSTIPGGRNNTAVGSYSFAAGQQAKAVHHGSFVWSDTAGLAISSSTNDEFTVRASGGVRFFSDSGATMGVVLNPGEGTWSVMSDRNAKTKPAVVNPEEILRRVTELPIQTWSYKAQPCVRHLGPMAQDFHAAFSLGADDKHISTVDADGVALAAIQGLNQKLEEKLSQKDAEIQSLKQSVAELTELTRKLAARAELLDAEGPKAIAESP